MDTCDRHRGRLPCEYPVFCDCDHCLSTVLCVWCLRIGSLTIAADVYVRSFVPWGPPSYLHERVAVYAQRFELEIRSRRKETSAATAPRHPLSTQRIPCSECAVHTSATEHCAVIRCHSRGHRGVTRIRVPIPPRQAFGSRKPPERTHLAAINWACIHTIAKPRT